MERVEIVNRGIAPLTREVEGRGLVQHYGAWQSLVARTARPDQLVLV